MPAKRPTRVIVETVGAGARKSVCFLDLLGWTVVAHERLRSRWPYFPPAVTLLPSVKVRIAFAAESAESEDGVPIRGRASASGCQAIKAMQDVAHLIGVDPLDDAVVHIRDLEE